MPVMRGRKYAVADGVVLNDGARKPRTDEHPCPIRNQRDQTLSRRAQCLRSLTINEDLAGDEEKVVADAVQKDASP
jgi:hypothetical protein